MQRTASPYFPFVLALAINLCGCDLLGLGKTADTKGDAVDRRATEETTPPLAFVGRDKCQSCHQEIFQSYAWSAHDRSLEDPQPGALEAPFSGEKLSERSLEASFEKKDDAPVIFSNGAQPVKWTMGFFPLQAYIVPGQDGRLLPFAGAYDTREKGDGGKKWFVPTPDEASRLHDLRNSSVDFNSACGSCHSTGFTKNYDYEANSYDSSFREMDVSCEACHGPASLHVHLAEGLDGGSWSGGVENFGFATPLATYTKRRWFRGPDDKVARLAGDGEAPPEKTEELLTCAPCHSSRVDWGPSKDLEAALDFRDRYALDLILDGAFFPDGQSRGGIATINGFAQTKMHAGGVVCSDCHNPHSGTLRSPVAELCVTCHDPAAYEGEAHTLHRKDQEITCVDCHMPERSFLGIDKARDHRFAIPRPDLTLEIELPSSCETCHPHRPKWAATIIDAKMGPKRPSSVAPAFDAAERGDPDAPEQLATILRDNASPAIVRATALVRWAGLGRKTEHLLEALDKASHDESYLLRAAAARGTALVRSEKPPESLTRLLRDPVRTVRLAAALAYLERPPSENLNEETKKALLEAKTALLFRADNVDAVLSLAALDAHLGDRKSMEHHYELAAKRFPNAAEVFVAWSAARGGSGDVEGAQEIVQRGLQLHPKSPALMFSRGRFLVRQEKIQQALPLLHGAFEGAPRTLRKEYGYVYAVTIHQAGDWAEALAILRLLKKEYPEEDDVKEALEIFEKKRGR